MTRLNRPFFDRCAREVAFELLGCRIVHRIAADDCAIGSIVEVEAYLGEGRDPGSHAYKGRTERNSSMFGPPGRFYVYRSMGIHACVNLVCGAPGVGEAVLVRAVEPSQGEADMVRRRSGRSGRELTNGPGKLTQAFAIDLDQDGTSALSGALRVLPPLANARATVMAGPRIGLTRGADLPYRFFLADNAYVTRSPFNRRARPIGC